MALLNSCRALSEKYKARVTPVRFFIHKTVDPQPNQPGGIKRLLYRECTASSKIMSPVEAVQRLQQRTKSRPVRGKFAKFTQYRLTLLEEDKVKTLPSGATVKGTTQYYHYKSCGKPGLLLRRKFPCFCSACLNDDSQNCPNASWSGKWEEVAVKAK